MKLRTIQAQNPSRRWLVLGLFLCAMAILSSRAIYLQLLNNDFLKEHGDARSIRVVDVPSHRGVIVDRNGEPLAMSTPVESIWVTPKKVFEDVTRLPDLANVMDMTVEELHEILRDRISRDFVYLKRHANPDLVKKVQALRIKGVSTQREYKRYYPAAEVTSHIVGFTNIDDQGQEGLELAYDEWLSGKFGKKRVLKDRLNRVIENIESIESSEPGKKLTLSIDRRVQYLAYRELAAAVKYHRAKGGSLVMLDIKTGEVMAMVGQPSYNPNNRETLKSHYYRNRAVTDVFEPGSTMKPFTIAAGLESGIYKPHTEINTSPGFYKVGDHTIRDTHNYGNIDVSTVITKSSNVGASKIALALEPEQYWDALSRFGFGQPTGSAFPGESGGILSPYNTWSDFEMATMSFGYGLSVTPLQLVQAYSVLANGGVMLPVSFIKVNDTVSGRRVIPENIARQVRKMLETVVSAKGTGKRAAIKGYRVIGKTGTVHKSVRGGYSEDRYLSLFAGIAPASEPRFAMVILIDEPRGDSHYGGDVAAPVFSRVMEGTFRILNIPPDDLPAITSPIMANTHKPDQLKGFQ
ncbi:MAG TPA: penicillin-binding protein 2 [Thiotrichaceae bacterium]|jgi:cell division protein FtsI (penicillin-binding protein 3)|nr:penicillin-binding protein 2 [Thiotrichaceae bacterium]HIM07167.1 penicillin-binding protein 2 [Gammaproteobacteria bacterium]